MDSVEFLERMAALTAGLQPSPGIPKRQIRELRSLLAFYLYESSRGERGFEELPSLLSRCDTTMLDPDLVSKLKNELSEESLTKTAAKLPKGSRISKRSLPIFSSAEPESVPLWGSGRKIDKSLGPFIDSDGRLVWFDIFMPVQQVSVVRSPSLKPFLLLPLRGFIIGSATSYKIPAGSIWMQSSLFTPDAPAGGFSGIRIKSGTMQLSVAPSVSGNTLVLTSGTHIRLKLKIAVSSSSAPGPEPGKDALAAVVDLPAEVGFEFTASGGTLSAAANAGLKVFGGAYSLAHAPGPVSYEPLINRILFPFNADPSNCTVSASDSDLVHLARSAPVNRAGWALPVAVAGADELGDAKGSGAIALNLGRGLQTSWRGLLGSHAQVGPATLMAETDRIVLVSDFSSAPGTRQQLRLWNAVNDGSTCDLSLKFNKFHFRFESLAGRQDAVVMSSQLQASTDRPVATDGRPFPLSAQSASTVFWQDTSAFKVLIQTALDQPANFSMKSIALKNALVTALPPVVFILSGELHTPDDVVNGMLGLIFRIQNLTLTLPDPYVTSQPLPSRFSRQSTVSEKVSLGPLLISLMTWRQPEKAQLNLGLLFPSHEMAVPVTTTATQMQMQVGTSRISPETAENNGGQTPGSFFSLLSIPSMPGMQISELPNPVQSKKEDDQAREALRDIFEESAGNARESLFLLDVSSNIGHLGVGWGYLDGKNQKTNGSGFPLQIDNLTLVTPGRNVRLFLLPQFQWEPIRNVPNPNIGFFPDRLVSGDDGGATLFGSNTVRLVPITPDRVLVNLVDQFENDKKRVGASFTLPFGIRAAAELIPESSSTDRWAHLALVQPRTMDDRFKGVYQLMVSSHMRSGGPNAESPSLVGAAWQTRNGVDPATGTLNGFSALRGDLFNEGVEAFFNDELGPGGKKPRVPVTRIDFAGLGASAFSKWYNPQAVAEISQVRFDVFVGRTAYEVIQVASVLYPWAVPVVRTITFERRKEGLVFRADSGWVATGPGIYIYPEVNMTATPPADWTKIETHPGLVRGAFNVRRIRETGRVVQRVISNENIELLEVRYDADIEVEGVIRGQINETERVPSIDQIGFVQRAPKGYPLVPWHLAEIYKDEGPVGGPVDCEIEIAGSGQNMRVVRVDVDATSPVPAGVPEFAAAARGALALPNDGAWSVVKRQISEEEYEPIDPIVGTPLIRLGRASNPSSFSTRHRFSDPRDLLRENNPDFEFGLLQSSDGHQFLFPRPSIEAGSSSITTTERSLLADAYARSTAAGIFPKRSSCFSSQGILNINITPQGRYKLGPSTKVDFNNISGGERQIVDGDALKIKTRYAGPIQFMLDPDDPEVWSVTIDTLTTSLDLGPFEDLMGVTHDFRVADALSARLIKPIPKYAPFLDPVIEIVKFLTDLLGIDHRFDIEAIQSSFKFQATAQYPIEGPGNSYIDFAALKIKGKIQAGFGWSEKDHWFGFFKVELGMKVPVMLSLFANGKTSIKLRGTQLTGQQIIIRMLWGVATEAMLGPLGVSAEFNYGIEVIVAEAGGWQIGLLVQVVGRAEIFIVMVAVRIELLAAIARLPAPDERVQAIGQAKFAAEVEICWFLTISVEYSIEYRETIDI